jgi:hypothetical protein
MKVSIGEYEIEVPHKDESFKPLEQNNASLDKTVIDGEDITVGFVYNAVYKQKRALEYGLEQIRKFYPNSKIYIVSDGGYDYSYLQDQYDNLKFEMGEDTIGAYTQMDFYNYREEENQKAIKKNIKVNIERIVAGIEYCEHPDWIFMTEPDVLLRGKVSYPSNAKLLGTRLNYAWDIPGRLDQYIAMNQISSQVDTSIPMFRWGAVPAIFDTKTYLKSVKAYKENFELLDDITTTVFGVNCFDVIVPFLFSLVGEEEVYNSEITECLRDPSWKNSSHPIVHQFREYYSDESHYPYIEIQ